MTGIERLRKVVRELGRFSFFYDLYETLGNIADQIEREQDASVADSPYEAILPEDREAIAWVREHGGIEGLSRLFQDAGNRRVELCAALGIDLDKGWSEAMAVMRLRLMPEDMKWPRYEDGEPVELGCEFVNAKGNASTLRTVVIKDCRDALGGSVFWKLGKGECAVTLKNGERVKRPAPKVLDADGVEIRVGDVLYRKSDGHMVKVAEVYEKTFTDADDYVRPGDGYTHRAPVLASDGRPLEVGQTVWRIDTGAEYWVKSCQTITADAVVIIRKTDCDCADETVKASQLTHRAPVLAADGLPLREREHVYHVETGAELVVKGLPKPGEYQAVVVFALPTSPASHLTSFDPDQLTHERPDTWERVEADCSKADIEYCEEHGLLDPSCNADEGEAAERHCIDCGCTCGEKMARDLVRRCRALAERERGE